jgi:hypothetical protein
MRFSDIPRNPDSRTLRQFATLWIVLIGTIGALQLHKGNSVGWLFIGLAVGAGIPGLLRPKYLKPVFVTWMILAFPVGWLVSHIMLALIFFGLFTLLGMMLKVMGHDALRRRKPASDTFWEARNQQSDTSRYLKQY